MKDGFTHRVVRSSPGQKKITRTTMHSALTTGKRVPVLRKYATVPIKTVHTSKDLVCRHFYPIYWHVSASSSSYFMNQYRCTVPAMNAVVDCHIIAFAFWEYARVNNRINL